MYCMYVKRVMHVCMYAWGITHIYNTYIHTYHRMDYPLKMLTPATTLRPHAWARLGYEGDLDKLSKAYQMATFNISKSPYILIPFMGSNIEMRMTVSEITEYPHSSTYI